MDFNGKRVLVTGAGQGIGRAVAKKLYERNARVVALSKTMANLDNLKQECPNIEVICTDLKDWNDSREQIKAIEPVHLLVNNAAVTSVKPFLEILPEDIDQLVSVNVKGIINVSQVVIQGILDRNDGAGGSIVNISSKASKCALKNHTVYCACKAAVDSITGVMALEFGPHKIRVNAVNPTVVLTAMGRKAWSDPTVANPLLARIPMGKFADECDVVNAVLFLLSDQAAMINGVTLPIDGGYLVG